MYICDSMQNPMSCNSQAGMDATTSLAALLFPHWIQAVYISKHVTVWTAAYMQDKLCVYQILLSSTSRLSTRIVDLWSRECSHMTGARHPAMWQHAITKRTCAWGLQPIVAISWNEVRNVEPMGRLGCDPVLWVNQMIIKFIIFFN